MAEKYYTKAAAITKAKQMVAAHACDGANRDWLSTSVVDCYNGGHGYTTQAHVLQGTPARGYILDMSHGMDGGTLLVLGFYGKRLGQLRYTRTGKAGG